MTPRNVFAAGAIAFLLGACHEPAPTPAPPAPVWPPRMEAKPHAWPDPAPAPVQASSEPAGPSAPAAVAVDASAAATTSAAGAPATSTEPEPAGAPPDPAGTRTQRRIDATPPTAPKGLVTPPAAPAQLAAVAVSETEVKLQWTAATDGVGAAGYEVVRAGHVVAGGPSLAAREMGLRPYTEYCYAVRAFDAAGNRSGPSPDACVRTLDTTPPSVPQHVVATATSDRAVQVLWQASTDNVGVTSYELRRADGVVAATSATAWAEERDLAPGRRYCYTVQAVDLAGNFSAPSAVACAVTPDLTPPTPPDAVAAQPVSSSSVFLVWQPSVDDVAVTGYELLSDGELTATVTGPEATAAVPNGKHCFRVRAFDAAGNRSALSDAICAVTADPSQPAAPFRLRAEPASVKAVQLSWQPSSVPGVVYRVYWEGGKSIGATRSTGFSAIGLKPGERHCYRVGAIDESGHESPRTLEACAAPRGEALTVRE